MARTYIEMLNSAVVYQRAFNMAHIEHRENPSSVKAKYDERRADAELAGYVAAMAEMFGKTIEDVKIDVHDFTEAIESH